MAPSRRGLLGMAATALAARGARAQPAEGGFPTRPLRLITPYAPGGSAVDLHARLFAEAMGDQLGQRMVVDNRPGAGGTIGAAQAARAPADGYTLLWAAGSLFECNPYLYRTIGYRLEDFSAIGAFSDASFVVFARPGLGVRTLAELLARMRAAPGDVRFATVGLGNQLRLTWERILRAAGGLEATLVPYPLTGWLTGLLAGDVDVSVAVLDTQLLQYFANGSMVPLAVTSAVRQPQTPTVPTMIEAGFPGFTANGGYAAFVPRGVPDAVLARLRAACDAVTADPATVARLDAVVAVVPPYRRAADYEAWLLRDREVWRQIIVEVGITLD